MTKTSKNDPWGIQLSPERSVLPASLKLAWSALAGVVAGLAVAVYSWKIAPLVGWDVAAAVYLLVTWRLVLGFGPKLVKSHALREDPSRVTSEVILLTASVVSLAAVAVVLVAGGEVSGVAKLGHTLLAVASVVVSWLIVQTVFTLRYAKMYYVAPEGGVDFVDTKEPIYQDFAYLAFTLAMTYQVSDTPLKSRAFRTAALQQAMLSYTFATIIIAITINLIAGLGK